MKHITRTSMIAAVAALVAVAALATGCVTMPNGRTGMIAAAVGAAPTADRWNTGDSLASAWTFFSTIPLHNIAGGGHGFITENIEDHTLAKLGGFRPQWMFVTGGVNDWFLPAADKIAAMEHFAATMAGLGIKLVWVTEPTDPASPGIRTFFVSQQPLNQWMLTQPYHADCAPAAEQYGMIDGLHPTLAGGKAYAACIEAAFPA